MAKIDDLAEQIANVSAGVIGLSQRIDALALRLGTVERQATNPDAHAAAHAELRDLCAANGISELPNRDPTGHFLRQDLERLYAQIRKQPGYQLSDGTCPAHEHTVQEFKRIFRHMGWTA